MACVLPGSLPATACDHECRRRAGGCVDAVLICCASEQSSRLHSRACWPRRARHTNAPQRLGDWCDSCPRRIPCHLALRHAALESLPQGHDQAASCCSTCMPQPSMRELGAVRVAFVNESPAAALGPVDGREMHWMPSACRTPLVSMSKRAFLVSRGVAVVPCMCYQYDRVAVIGTGWNHSAPEASPDALLV